MVNAPEADGLICHYTQLLSKATCLGLLSYLGSGLLGNHVS